MFLVLSKSLDLLAAPLTWVALLLLGAAVFARRPRASRAMSAAALTVLGVFSSQPVANRLAAWLEPRSGTFSNTEQYDVVIVLGGALDPEASQAVGRPQYHEGVERILAAADLLRSGAAREALLSGGLISPSPALPAEAAVLKQQLVDLGLDPGRIWLEEQSRNTLENALNSRAIVAAHGWKRLLLVTSAAHMPRAAGCFRAAGMAVDTFPVHYHLALSPSGLSGFLPRARNLAQSTDLLRELLGRGVYRALGYSQP